VALPNGAAGHRLGASAAQWLVHTATPKDERRSDLLASFRNACLDLDGRLQAAWHEQGCKQTDMAHFATMDLLAAGCQAPPHGRMGPITAQPMAR
jgi:hypothetical protein